VFNFGSRPLYPGNEPLYPVNKKLGDLQKLSGENKNFLPFPNDDPYVMM
jgi:hypothetical protein